MMTPDLPLPVLPLAIQAIDLFGKPSASEFRRMGVAVATAEDVEIARERAREAASRVTVVREVRPVIVGWEGAAR